jgi:ArsR family metal-binding transcriptional regulator
MDEEAAPSSGGLPADEHKEQLDRIKEAVERGDTVQQIMDREKLDPMEVHRILARMGLSPN